MAEIKLEITYTIISYMLKVLTNSATICLLSRWHSFIDGFVGRTNLWLFCKSKHIRKMKVCLRLSILHATVEPILINFGRNVNTFTQSQSWKNVKIPRDKQEIDTASLSSGKRMRMAIKRPRIRFPGRVKSVVGFFFSYKKILITA